MRRKRCTCPGAISSPIVFRGPNGAAAGVGAQHSQCFAAWYMSIPGLKVLAPYDAEDARGLLKAAIRDPDPVVFLENELLYGQEFALPKEALDEDFVLPIGKAVIMRPAPMSPSSPSPRWWATASKRPRSSARRASAEVINLRSLPRSTAAPSPPPCARQTAVVVEEGWPQCGVGAEITGGSAGRLRSPDARSSASPASTSPCHAPRISSVWPSRGRRHRSSRQARVLPRLIPSFNSRFRARLFPTPRNALFWCPVFPFRGAHRRVVTRDTVQES